MLPKEKERILFLHYLSAEHSNLQWLSSPSVSVSHSLSLSLLSLSLSLSFCLSLCLSLTLSFSLSLSVSLSLSLFFSFFFFFFLSPYLSIYLYIYPSNLICICIFIYPSIYLSHLHYSSFPSISQLLSIIYPFTLLYLSFRYIPPSYFIPTSAISSFTVHL